MIRSFTLFEILVNIILVAIIATSIFSFLFSINKQFKNYSNANQNTVDNLLFYTTIRKLWTDSDVVVYNGSELIFQKDSNIMVYNFQDSLLVIRNDTENSKDIDTLSFIQKSKIQIQSFTSQNPEVVYYLNLSYFIGIKNYNVVFNKEYNGTSLYENDIWIK